MIYTSMIVARYRLLGDTGIHIISLAEQVVRALMLDRETAQTIIHPFRWPT